MNIDVYIIHVHNRSIRHSKKLIKNVTVFIRISDFWSVQRSFIGDNLYKVTEKSRLVESCIANASTYITPHESRKRHNAGNDGWIISWNGLSPRYRSFYGCRRIAMHTESSFIKSTALIKQVQYLDNWEPVIQGVTKKLN